MHFDIKTKINKDVFQEFEKINEKNKVFYEFLGRFFKFHEINNQNKIDKIIEIGLLKLKKEEEYKINELEKRKQNLIKINEKILNKKEMNEKILTIFRKLTNINIKELPIENFLK